MNQVTLAVPPCPVFFTILCSDWGQKGSSRGKVPKLASAVIENSSWDYESQYIALSPLWPTAIRAVVRHTQIFSAIKSPAQRFSILLAAHEHQEWGKMCQTATCWRMLARWPSPGLQRTQEYSQKQSLLVEEQKKRCLKCVCMDGGLQCRSSSLQGAQCHVQHPVWYELNYWWKQVAVHYGRAQQEHFCPSRERLSGCTSRCCWLSPVQYRSKRLVFLKSCKMASRNQWEHHSDLLNK